MTTMRIIPSLIVLLAASSCTSPKDPGYASIGGEVHDASGTSLADTRVRITCPGASAPVEARTTSPIRDGTGAQVGSAYSAFVEVPGLIQSGGASLACRFEAPDVSTGPLAKVRTVGFYPLGVPMPLQRVDLP